MTEYSKQYNKMQEEFLMLKRDIDALHKNMVIMVTKLKQQSTKRVPPTFKMEGVLELIVYKNERAGTYQLYLALDQAKALALRDENMFLHNNTTCDADSEGPCKFPNTHNFIHQLMERSMELDTQ